MLTPARPASRLPAKLYPGGVKLLLVVLVFAAATYLAVRWLQDRGYGNQQVARRPGRPRPPAAPPRQIAPDDDETFLRDLDRKRRRQEQRDQPPETPET